MKFNGSQKQVEWAKKIIEQANLTSEQIDNLLRWAGPTLYAQGVMQAGIVIDNRRNLGAYADALGKFYKLSAKEKHAVAEEAVGMVHNAATAATVRLLEGRSDEEINNQQQEEKDAD